MKKGEAADARMRLTLSLVVLALVGAAIFVPMQFRSEAATQTNTKRGLVNRTESHEPGLEYYDIRTDKSQKASDNLLRFRSEAGTTAYALADTRESFVRGEEALKTKVPTLKVEYSPDLGNPEVITPDVWKPRMESLSGPTDVKRADVLKNFIKGNNQLIGVNDGQADSLKVVADYENPAGNMGFAYLVQEVDGIPVFRGEIKAGFRNDGSMLRVVNNLAPGLDYSSLSKDFGDPLDAIRTAATNIKADFDSLKLKLEQGLSDANKKVYGTRVSSTTAERMYFPTEIGVARPAWRVLIWKPVNAYYVIVDAQSGTVLWRKNITEDQTQAATYEVYRNSNSLIDVADSPAPLTPGPEDPSLGTQGSLLTRENVTLIGNEGALSFNTNGWITDDTNGTDGWTDGNATEAGIDIDGTDGVDAPVVGASRVFSSGWNPPPGNPGPGDDPTTDDARYGAVVQMFYVMNRYHDALYQLGFNEQAFNFQNDNFGRGGAGGDRISSEGQDSSGTNNANFSTPADGSRGKMQMYRFTGMTPNRDGTTDADIIIHEATHGTSNRLHGNASGLGTNMSRGMGEGWSDFYAHSLLSEPSDPINGIYTTGGYNTLEITSGFTGNYYYGIRRFPKAVIAFTGGPNNKPHNPLTFANLNAGNCSSFDSAFPRGPIGSSTCDQVHNAGEIWSSALWEVRALMVTRLGWADGNQRALQVVTDGMKLAPLNPTFLQERDAIIAAASALPAASEDVSDVREGFRLRGMGYSAEVISTSPASVVEAFDFPNVRYSQPFSVDDSPGDGDGYPEPGENVLISVPVENSTGGTITNVAVTINGGSPVSYGDIVDGDTVTEQIPYSIPASVGTVACGAFFNINIVVSSDAGTQQPVTEQFRLGAPVGGPAATFTSADGPIDLPGGQPTTTSGPSDPYPSVIDVSGLSGNKKITVELTELGHSWVGDMDILLESPGGEALVLMSDVFSSSNRTNTVISTLTIRDDAADVMPGLGVPPVTGDFKPSQDGGTGDTWDGPAPSGPYGQPGPDGAGDTFLSTFGMDGSAMNGQWKLWIDDDASADYGTMTGWKITFESDDYTCGAGSGAAEMDFDGDGKTDPSVFRPSPAAALDTPGPEGSTSQWWIYKSSDSGNLAYTFGSPSDQLVPADFTGDGIMDVAFWRPSTGEWFVLRSEDNSYFSFPFGQSGDIAAPGDFDGDGKADPTVYRPSTGVWYSIRSSTNSVSAVAFGSPEDKPTIADFDGDGKADIAVFRPSLSQWWQLRSTEGLKAYAFGAPGDRTITGDWTGDGKADVAFYRPSTSEFFVIRSEDESYFAFTWGSPGDIVVPGDYDGDGQMDPAVFRPSNNTWYILGSTAGFSAIPYGASGDVPLPSVYGYE